MKKGATLWEQGYRKALITGTSTGIGSALKDAFIQEGLEVIGISRRAVDSNDYYHLNVDLLDPDQLKYLLQTLREDPPDIWVNNAGHGMVGDAWAPSEKEIQTIHQLLYEIPVELTRFFADLCSSNTQRPAYMIQVSSLAVELPIPAMPYYNAAKSALSAFTQSLLLDGELPFRIIDFRPGDFKTEFMNNPSIARSATAGSPIHRTLVQRHLDAPEPEAAALRLIAAMSRKHCGILRSGRFFQSRIAPLGPRLLPTGLLHRLIRSYYR